VLLFERLEYIEREMRNLVVHWANYTSFYLLPFLVSNKDYSPVFFKRELVEDIL
jgi:hypothetical protein